MSRSSGAKWPARQRFVRRGTPKSKPRRSLQRRSTGGIPAPHLLLRELVPKRASARIREAYSAISWSQCIFRPAPEDVITALLATSGAQSKEIESGPMSRRGFGVTNKRGLGARCRGGHEDFGSVVIEPLWVCRNTRRYAFHVAISGFLLSHALCSGNRM